MNDHVQFQNISFVGRPRIIFDPSNREHRELFATFMEKHSWSHCPVRFVVDEDVGNLPAAMQRKVIEYYFSDEFGKTFA